MLKNSFYGKFSFGSSGGGDGGGHDMRGITKIGNLMYQNQSFTEKYTWKEAKKYCKDLTLGEYSDWRLPTRKEISKLATVDIYYYNNNIKAWKNFLDKNKDKKYKNTKSEYHFIDKRFIENMPKYSYFWTLEKQDSSHVWIIRFFNGAYSRDPYHYMNHALCVR